MNTTHNDCFCHIVEMLIRQEITLRGIQMNQDELKLALDALQAKQEALITQVDKVKAEVISAAQALQTKLDELQSQLSNVQLTPEVTAAFDAVSQSVDSLGVAIQAIDDLNPDVVP